MNRYTFAKAGIDVNEGVHRFNDKQELYERFLRRFPENQHYFDEIEEGIMEKNVEKAFQAAHALKGVAGNLSMNQLHADLVPLVEELRDGKIGNAPEFLPKVRESYEKAIEAVEKVYANENA